MYTCHYQELLVLILADYESPLRFFSSFHIWKRNIVLAKSQSSSVFISCKIWFLTDVNRILVLSNSKIKGIHFYNHLLIEEINFFFRVFSEMMWLNVHCRLKEFPIEMTCRALCRNQRTLRNNVCQVLSDLIVSFEYCHMKKIKLLYFEGKPIMFLSSGSVLTAKQRFLSLMHIYHNTFW